MLGKRGKKSSNESTLNHSLEKFRTLRSSSKKIKIPTNKKISKLLLMHSSLSVSKKLIQRVFAGTPTSNAKTDSKSWLVNIRASTPTSHIHPHNQALDSLSKSPYLVSRMPAYISKIKHRKVPQRSSPLSSDSQLKSRVSFISNPYTLDKPATKRISMRKTLSKKDSEVNLVKQERSFKSIPRLKISNICYKPDATKPTSETNETAKYKIQDYQDEFMSKFLEFSESWRQLIIQQTPNMG